MNLLVKNTLRNISSSSSVAASSSIASSIASASIAANKVYKLPDLGYDYNGLEPFISSEIMTLHHTKHHQAYITNLNIAIEKYSDAQAKGDVSTMISLEPAIKFNGGGYINHCIFWENLAPVAKGGGGAPKGDLAKAIDAKWGNFDNFKNEFSTKAVGIQGSGWAWLANHPRDGLTIVTTANQDPCVTTGTTPLFSCDVWEHGYYLQYKNLRADYVKALWSVANWNDVSKRYASIKTGKN